MAATPLLELRDVVAGYAEAVVGPVSLAIAPGEVVGLTGPNGCGKSTLLGAVTGRARCFSGSVRRAPATRLAYLAQSPALPGELPLSTREVLHLMDGGTRPPARVAALLDRRLDRLSGGQRQSVLLWAVLAAAAELVLLDEPTSNLDREGRSLLADALAALPPDHGVLLVSHEQAYIDRVCHRVVDLTPEPA